MSLPSEIREALAHYGGVITTSQANDLGFSNERLRLLEGAGALERVTHGVYIEPNDFVDKMYVVQLRRPKAIYSHETALFLHGLTDRDPMSYTVTLPTGYNAMRLRRDGINVFTVKQALHRLGTVQARTVFGHLVTAYGLERTICDCIRSRNQMDIAVVTDAVKRYARRGDKNLNILMTMAETFRVAKTLKGYLEVLL